MKANRRHFLATSAALAAASPLAGWSQNMAKLTLQAAWDRSDIPALRAMMTDDMLKEIQAQLAERETHTGSGPNHTDVVMIEAR
eukprot:gene14998-20286_t